MIKHMWISGNSSSEQARATYCGMFDICAENMDDVTCKHCLQARENDLQTRKKKDREGK